MAALPEKEAIVKFLVGRMNPPTPGHIDGLCIPLLEEVRMAALERLFKDPKTDRTPLGVLVVQANIIPRIYLMHTSNTVKLENEYIKRRKKIIADSKGRDVAKALKANDDRYEAHKKSFADTLPGAINLDDDYLVNPLEPDVKKEIVKKMIVNSLLSSKNSTLFNTDDKGILESLDNWIVCKTPAVDADCSINMVAAIICASNLLSPKILSNLHFYMGEDGITDMGSRNSLLAKTYMDNTGKIKIASGEGLPPEGLKDPSKITPKKLPRITCDSTSATSTGSDCKTSMSGSKIRALIANNADILVDGSVSNNLLKSTYGRYLDYNLDIINLVELVKKGLYMKSGPGMAQDGPLKKKPKTGGTRATMRNRVKRQKITRRKNKKRYSKRKFIYSISKRGRTQKR